MDKFGKKYCTEEERISKEQFLTEIYLLLKEQYIAKFENNGERIKVQLLNGQTFLIKTEEI